jgi:hypothetical protein
MVEVTVTVNYKGRKYYTNVIADKNLPWEKIIRIAEEQVSKQWGV